MSAPGSPSGGKAGFDFLVGRWAVRHRRLKERLAGCTQWESFSGTTVMWQLLGGAMNVDDNLLELPSGPYRAASLRTFDAQSGLWSIWWVDGRDPHRLDPPVRGGFEGGVGTFLADDVLRGRPIRVRYLWSGIGPSAARWEQAFSGDGGLGWETNWVMDFERIGAAA